jgi:hypothetical protein
MLAPEQEVEWILGTRPRMTGVRAVALVRLLPALDIHHGLGKRFAHHLADVGIIDFHALRREVGLDLGEHVVVARNSEVGLAHALM